MNRIGIFVDVNNIISAFGIKLIVPNIVSAAEKIEGGVVTTALFYIGVSQEEKSQKFHNMLICLARDQGNLRVVSKNEKVFLDGHRKANLDVNIAVDAIAFMDRYDTAIIMSGDGDFAYLAKHLQAHGKRVVSVGVAGAQSSELEDAVDHCYSEHSFGDAFMVESKNAVHATVQVIKAKSFMDEFKEETDRDFNELIKRILKSTKKEKRATTLGLNPGEKVTSSFWNDGKLTIARKENEDAPTFVTRAFYELTGRKVTKKVNATKLQVVDSKDWMWEGVRFETVRKGAKVIGLKLK